MNGRWLKIDWGIRIFYGSVFMSAEIGCSLFIRTIENECKVFPDSVSPGLNWPSVF